MVTSVRGVRMCVGGAPTMTYVITWTVPVQTAVPPDGRDRIARRASYQIFDTTLFHCYIKTYNYKVLNSVLVYLCCILYSVFLNAS